MRVPTKKPPQGFKEVYLLRGSDPDKLVIAGLWETKANSDAWQNSKAYQEWRGQMAGAVAAPMLRKAMK